MVSDRDLQANDDSDVWVRALPEPGAQIAAAAIRVTNTLGTESSPVWAPDNNRVAYAATRAGQNGVWVSVVPEAEANSNGGGGGRGGRGRGTGAPGGGFPGLQGPSGLAGPSGLLAPVLASR